MKTKISSLLFVFSIFIDFGQNFIEKEIQKLNLPILIINGTKDIQVSVSDAELLHKMNNASEIQIIEHMNHIFKEVKGDRNKNLATYNNDELPIMKELVAVITKFVTQIK